MEVKRQTLKNGLDTLFIQAPGFSSGSVQIWFRAGSALEDHSNEGIAHFLEHMFFKGTKKRPGAMIAHEVESFGGELNAFTSFDYTCYYINSPKNHLYQSTDILLDMVSNPQFKQVDLLPERQVVFEEYRRSLDNPNQYNFHKIQENSFEGNYAHPILGREETILNFSLRQLKDFRNQNYSLANALLVVGGDFNEEKLSNLIEKFKLPKGSSSSFPSFSLKKKSKISTHQKDVKQATLTLNWQSYPYKSQESAAEDLALNCLSHGESSYLYKELLAKKGLINGVSASTLYFVDGGIHFLRLACPRENLKSALQEFKSTLEVLIKQGFQEEDIQKIKNQYIAGKVYEKESIESYTFSLGHGFAQTGDVFCEDEFINKMKNLSIVQINQGLKSLLSKAAHLEIQLPEGEKLTKEEKIFTQEWQSSLKNLHENKVATKIKSKKSKVDPLTQLIELKPGVELIYRHHAIAPTFILQAFLRGGLSQESKSNNGLYNLLSRSINYGHQKLSYDKLKLDLESKSASLYGIAGKNAYGLTMHGQTQDFSSLGDHFFQTLLTPSFQHKYVQLEKKLTLRSLENRSRDPIKQCFRSFNQNVFASHPYGLDLLGEKESIKKINAKMIKEAHQKNLKKEKLVITYIGDLDLDSVLKLIDPYLKELKPRKSNKPQINKMKPVFQKHIHLDFIREQTQIFMGYPAFKLGTKQELYLKVLTSYLSGQSSPLFVDVRDRKGLCYSVQPVHFSALEGGYWGVYIGAGADKTELAIQAIQDLLKDIATQGFSKEEFQRVLTMIQGNFELNIQTANDYAGIYTIPVLQDLGLDFTYQKQELIQKMSLKDFNGFLSKFLSKEPMVVSAGP